MFTVYYQGAALERTQTLLKKLTSRQDSDWLAADLTKVIIEGNRRDRLAGVDKNGVPLVALMSVRRGKYSGATGPPLAPFRERSRVITNFFAKIARKWGFGNFQIEAGWTPILSEPNARRDKPYWDAYYGGTNKVTRLFRRVKGTDYRGGVPFLPFHLEGSGRLPRRDIAGISPKTWTEVESKFRDWQRITGIR